METRIKTALDGFRKSVLDAHGMDFPNCRFTRSSRVGHGNG